MKQIILSFSLLIFLLFSGQSNAQKTSISENENYRIEKVYPNPVSNQVSIQFYSENYSTVQFELINILGNKIKQWKKMELIPGVQRIKLDFQDLDPGFYLIKATVDGQVIVKRIRKL